MPPPARQKHRGSGLLITAIISAGIIGLTAVSLAKVNHIAINSISANKVSMQAQQYAASKADLIRSIKYDNLTAQNRTNIQNSNFQDEVIVAAESDYPGDNNIKQKVCTVNVYNGSENIPRSSLILTRLSVSSSDSSVPQGSIIPWYGQIKDIPSGFALCDGKNGTPDLRDRFIVGAGSSYTLGNLGGSNNVTIKSENLPNDGLSGFGYVVMGIDFTWRRDMGVLEGEDTDLASVDGSNSWKTTSYFSKFNSLVSKNWKGIPLDTKPPYYAVYYIMKL